MITGAAATTRRASVSRTPDDEAALMAGVLARDTRAFERLYRLYHPRLTRFLMGMTRRAPLVDEVLNDTMLVVWNRPERFDPQARLSSWIFAIAYRQALRAMKRQDMPVEDDDADARACPDPDPEQRLGAGRAARALVDVLSELPANHRAVVELTYFQDFGYREIAEIMGCPVDTVKTRMFHARRRLGRMFTGTLADWL